MLSRLVFLMGVMLVVAGCTAMDPAARDIRSPCASDDSNVNSPCIRRVPLENQRV